ncbi:MAG: hypothetical protein ACK4I8_12170, partial [Armatimonadota bacterium]
HQTRAVVVHARIGFVGEHRGPKRAGLRDEHSVNAYQCLPATAAQQVVRDVADSFKAWAAALKAYAKNPAGFTGRPAMPGYLARHERSVVGLPWASLASGKLPGLTQRSLFLDFERTQSVSEEAKAALSSLNLQEAVQALQARHRLGTAPGPWRCASCRNPATARTSRWSLN